MQKSPSLHLRKRMVKVFVWNVVLYGSETWTLRKEDIRRLEAFEMWIWRRMMKVSWIEHKTNEEVLQMVDTEREMMDTLRSRQKRWLGHILRHDSLLRSKDNVRRTIDTREKRLWKTKNNVLGLVIEDGGRQYHL